MIVFVHEGERPGLEAVRLEDELVDPRVSSHELQVVPRKHMRLGRLGPTRRTGGQNHFMHAVTRVEPVR